MDARQKHSGMTKRFAISSLIKEEFMIRKIMVVILLVLAMTASAPAKEIGGVNLPDSLAAGKEQLVLSGAGLRTKMFIKVYAGGLYLRKQDNDAQKIIGADEPMAIRLHFIYDGVSHEQLIEAWNEGFASATGGNIAPLKESIERFNSFFTEAARKGNIYDIVYTPGEGVTVIIKGKLIGTIKGLEFKKAAFAIWLGDKPADNSLKKGLLGR
jgi:hypothetical protein